jgi:predicted nucleic acid-binding protein
MFHPEISDGPAKSCTVPKISIDTNILVYSLDHKDEAKREKSRKILKKIVESHQPVISSQA